MSRDSEERLYENKFIKRPYLEQIPEEQSKGFRKYYSDRIAEQTKKVILDKVNTQQVKNTPKTKQISNYLDNKTISPFSDLKFDDNMAALELKSPIGSEKYKKEKETIISIDSADRDIYSFPDANNFTVNLGTTFYNVKSIRLVSSEFPNSERVVKDSASGEAQNNKITWINEEDYKFAAPTYSTKTPFEEYNILVNPGNYAINTIDEEISDRLNDNVKRLEGTGDPHFFLVESSLDIGEVSLSSFKKFTLNSVNPISTTFVSGATTGSSDEATNKSFFVTVPSHGIRDNYSYSIWISGTVYSVDDKITYNNVVYVCKEAHTSSSVFLPPITQSKWAKFSYQGNTIYIDGIQSTGGIPSANMNGIFTNFKVVSVNTIQVFIEISCSFTDAGGGNVGVIGVSQPYQLLFGDEELNIGNVLGFPIENSSDFINEGYLSTSSFKIKDVDVGTKTTFYTQVVYAAKSISVSVAGNTTITTSIPHELVDGDQVFIQDSNCLPNIDSFVTDSYLDQVYYTVTRVDELSFTIPATVTTAGTFCSIVFPDGDNQLTSTVVFTVSSLAPDTDASISIITTTSAHGLAIGDVILLETNSISGSSNLPSLNSNFTVLSVPSTTQITVSYTLQGTFSFPILVSKLKFGGDKIIIDSGLFSTPSISGAFLVEDSTPTSFAIDFETSFVDQATIKNGIIRSDVLTMYHPNHLFNKVVRSGNNSFKFDIGNNQLTLQEDSGDKFTLIYPTGTQTSAEIISYLGPALSAKSPNSRTYTITFTGDLFTITISSGTFKILGTESNILQGFRIPQVDTSLASSFSGSVLTSNSTFLLPHNVYGQTLKILDIQDDASESLTASLWLGKLESDTYTGDNILTSFSTSNPILFPDADEVYVGGVLQTLGVDYTATLYSSSIDFTVPPGLGVDIELKTVITTRVDTDYTGDGVTSAFLSDDDILDSSLVSVYADDIAGLLTQGVDYTITLPRTIVFTVTPPIDYTFQIRNIVNNSHVTKEQPSGKITGSYMYLGTLGSPTSYIVLDGVYDTVNVINTSTVRIHSVKNIAGYSNAGVLGPSGQPYFYNSNGLLETDYSDYTAHNISNVVDILDTSTVDQESTYGVDTILGAGDKFKIYRVNGNPVNTDGLFSMNLRKINNNLFTVNKIINKDFYNFKVLGQYASITSYTTPGDIYMSSYKNGFSYKQDNTGTAAGGNFGSGPYRGLKLSGNNYVFLTSPGLETIANTNVINNVFAKILLSEPPGNIIFNSFVSNAKIFDEVPLAKLEKLQFKVIGSDKFLYDFNNNDFSFSMEIVEYIDALKSTGISSRTGSVDTAGKLKTIYIDNKKLAETS